jgi:GT2 family glycosyltransferase/Flp pilus assembly protein TadD
MAARYLFGPLPRAFAEQKLHRFRQAGNCLSFHPEPGEADITFRPHETWEDLCARLPVDWRPDLLVLSLAYTTIPECLWTAPLPRLGLAPDWNLLWHYYRRRLPGCDWAITDTWGAELLNQAGLSQVRPGNLCGCDRVFVETNAPDTPRDIDVLLIGNFNPAVQRERMPWLARLACLGRRWRVVLRSGVFGESYRRLLARSRIVFQASARHKSGPRAFEAAAAGALVFQERDNRELPSYFRDRQEGVYYRPDEVERLLEYYLEHEEERRAIAEAGRLRAQKCTFEDLWEEVLASITTGGASIPVPAQRTGQPAPSTTEALLTRCWQALASSRFEDDLLVADLEKALATEPKSASLLNALGVMLGRKARNPSVRQAAAEVAADFFRRALDSQPDNARIGLNLAEALAAAADKSPAGQKPLAAIEAARRTLELLQRDARPPVGVDDLPWNQGFDLFAVEWERAAWSNAGRPELEQADKAVLLRWRLYALLAEWTGELSYAYEAALLRPDLSATKAVLGRALLNAGQPNEALTHLRSALAGNPLDRRLALDCFKALRTLGDRDGVRRLVEDRRDLARACPSLVPAEAWFAEPRPTGDELASIIVLCCDQLDYTRGCLESLLRCTRAPYELILVDNGSTDGTLAYLEAVRHQRGPARVEVLRNESNRGVPAAWNQAIARARGRYLVFLNNDTVLAPGWLEGLVSQALHDWPRVGLVGPVTNGAPEPQGIRAGYDSLEHLDAFAAQRRQDFAGRPLLVRRLTGFCLLVRREVLERVGTFDERFGLGFFEDDDLGVRAQEAGYRLVVARDVYVHHYGNRTFEHLGIDFRQRMEANFELFKSKWGPEYTTGYRLPPRPPAEGKAGEPPASQPEETAAVTEEPVGQADSAAESLPEPADELATAADVPAGIIPPASRVRVSLCMIVRNEEHHLPDCLRSVAGLFDETVVVDTGSTDGTAEVARQLGASVYALPWPDSFGAARNEGLRHAHGQWILWLDADDRLDADNRKRLQELLAGLGDERDAYAMKVRSVLDANRTSFRLLDQVRLFRNLPEIRWDFRVHEQILPAVNRAGGVVRWAKVIIDHVGYQDAGARRGKLERNLRLLEMDFAERPDDPFTLFNLGWTLMDLGRTDEALTHLQNARARSKPTSSTLHKIYHLLTVLHRQLDRRDEALAICEQGLERFPADAELLCEHGALVRDRGDFRAAEKSWLRVLETPRGQYFGSEDVGLRGFRTRHLLAEVYRAQERWVEAEVQWRAALAERVDFEPAWLALADIFLRGQRWSELDYLLEGLERHGIQSSKTGWLRARGQAQRKEWAAARRTLAAVIAHDPKAIGPRKLLTDSSMSKARLAH